MVGADLRGARQLALGPTKRVDTLGAGLSAPHNTKVDGAEVDPIQVYTADEELTVSFGFWETNTPAPYELWETDPEVIAQHAKELVERWLSEDVRTAVLTDQGGKWSAA